jgi:hypothetical protein
MKTLRSLVALAAITLASSTLAVAQDMPKATKHENVSWYMNFNVRFKDNKADEAQKIISQYFIPADKAIGREVLAFQCKSGRWDLIFFVPLKDGTADLAWKISTSDEKWLAALAKTAGSAQKAQEVLAKWDELVVDWNREIVFRQM